MTVRIFFNQASAKYLFLITPIILPMICVLIGFLIGLYFDGSTANYITSAFLHFIAPFSAMYAAFLVSIFLCRKLINTLALCYLLIFLGLLPWFMILHYIVF
ncbi:hypothetical protein V202x_01900 [Gimesia aquarii]|uniref:Uncharacterized protein n=1 Tax=Gimesia aquarii TaxID=2527964 RepID=A0A517WNK4_9PLAN|nr:hypothetical protein V202x_01900 [Gimesia aquarii]